ncbi:WecB/TagA/CpsF family glycosyltransferase [Candidatus Microgenomates bacterium]|nr:WecB/TagA/CpsF family glycosyltransferase [Candidatus Microgenomates bacterium]
MSRQTSFPKVEVLGVELDNLTIDQAIKHLIELTAPAVSQSYYVVKPHVEHLFGTTRNPADRELLNQADLALPDGVSLNWAAYFHDHTRHRLIDLVTSVAKIVFQPTAMAKVLPHHSWAADFTWQLLAACAAAQRSVVIINSPPGSTEANHRVVDFLGRVMPKLKIVGTLPGRDPQTRQPGPRLTRQLIAELKRLRPDVVFVAMGYPRQEKLSAELAATLDHGVFIGEGGTFDYDKFGGSIKRAPAWVQRHGLEWLWRMLRQPWRLKRQLAIPRFMWRVYRDSR